MLERLRAALMRQGERAVRARRDGIAAAARASFPELNVAQEGDEVVLSGRGLLRRMLREPRLRWPGGWG